MSNNDSKRSFVFGSIAVVGIAFGIALIFSGEAASIVGTLLLLVGLGCAAAAFLAAARNWDRNRL